MKLDFASRSLELGTPKVMGIVNVTPDSFYDGGRYLSGAGVDIADVVHTAEQMVNEGAAFIDVGGESTRPGAERVSEQQELDRVIPAVEALKSSLDVVISVDTSTPKVMLEAAKAGAGLINDVRALQREGALEAAAKTELPVCLMHMQGDPQTMQNNPVYADVVKDVSNFLLERIAECEHAGISRGKLILDPGFGFGKTDEHNIKLLNELSQLKALGCPLLIGVSRKSMIGRLIGRDVQDRLPASLALALIAMQNGASILRVHDVQQTVDVVNILNALNTR